MTATSSGSRPRSQEDRCRVPGAIHRLATLPLTPHGNRNCQATATIARSGITREPETPEGGRCVGAQPRSGGALGLDGFDAQVGQVAEQRSGIPPFAVGGRR